jgi:hypothetical protein
MILETYEKQPVERKDYDVDMSPWLDPALDAMDECTATVICLTDAADTTLVVTTQITAKIIKVWVSGGTSGNRYKITLTVTTLGARIDQSELIFKIKDR